MEYRLQITVWYYFCLSIPAWGPDLILQALKNITVRAPRMCRSCLRPAVIVSIHEKIPLKRVVHARVRLKSLPFMPFSPFQL